MNPKISIIVPIYQVEKYIANSIMSICNQSFKEFEVILVNDGTKDRSVEIAQKILQTSNIKYNIINQTNKGVSAARNEGTRNANGEWIICIDSDDVVNEDFLKILYNGCVDNDVNVAIGNYQVVSKSNSFKIPNKIYSSVVISQKEILYKFLVRRIKILAPAMLLRKKFILENQLWYNENMRFSEDLHFVWRVLLSTDKVVYNPTPIYNYVIRENSIMRASNIEKILTGYNGFVDFSNSLDKTEYDNITKYVLPRWVFAALRASTNMMDYKNFKILANKMHYKKYTRDLLFFPDYRVKILSLILMISLKSFYLLNKRSII